jgi:uncharacterized protein (TIGR02271 family)
MPEMTDAYQWAGRTMVGSDGEKIGKISDVYEDPATGQMDWATVSSGLFGTKSNFVPLAGASPDGENVRANVTKDQVKDAPGVEDDGDLSEAEEQRLFEHYGVPYTSAGSTTAQAAPDGNGDTDTGHPGTDANAAARDRSGTDQVGHDTSGPTTDDAMTRSEEELTVGTRQREAGRARLRKHVVTEMVTKTVPVSHEEVTIEREPITDANRDQATDGPDISEEEHEVVLHADEVVVDKQAVAKERVRMGTDTVTEDHEVSEEVRKEQIEAEGTDGVGTAGRDRSAR